MFLHVFVCLFTLVGGGRLPHPTNEGVPHSQVRMGEGGTSFPGLDGGYPIPGLDGRVPSSQVWMGGTPLPRSGQGVLWMGFPAPCQETEQHSEHLLRGGRYVSCIHAGGLSCFTVCIHTGLHYMQKCAKEITRQKRY